MKMTFSIALMGPFSVVLVSLLCWIRVSDANNQVLAEDGIFSFKNQDKPSPCGNSTGDTCPPKMICFKERGHCVAVECTLNSHCKKKSFCHHNICLVTPRTKVKSKGGVKFRSASSAKRCDDDSGCRAKGFKCVNGRCIKAAKEKKCSDTEKCPGKKECKDGVCRTPCKTNNECFGAESICTKGVCVRRDKVKPPKEQKICVSPKDCGRKHLYCIEGICVVKRCIFDKTCSRHNPTCRFKCKKVKPTNKRSYCIKDNKCQKDADCEKDGEHEQSCFGNQCWRKCDNAYQCVFDGYPSTEYRCYDGKCIHINFIPEEYCDATIPCDKETGKICDSASSRCVIPTNDPEHRKKQDTDTATALVKDETDEKKGEKEEKDEKEKEKEEKDEEKEDAGEDSEEEGEAATEEEDEEKEDKEEEEDESSGSEEGEVKIKNVLRILKDVKEDPELKDVVHSSKESKETKEDNDDDDDDEEEEEKHESDEDDEEDDEDHEDEDVDDEADDVSGEDEDDDDSEADDDDDED